MLALATPFFSGLGLGAGLIIAIGAQNAFVLRQGLLRRHVFLVTTICFSADLTLIVLGVAGFGSLVATRPALTAAAAWGGAAFLIWYGLRAAHAAIAPSALRAEAAPATAHRIVPTAATTLAVSLLNPHVYLDTVILIGGLAAQYQSPARGAFGAGAVLASMLWFYALGYGARLLAPLFARPLSWRLLDLIIAAIMWAIAARLILAELAA